MSFDISLCLTRNHHLQPNFRITWPASVSNKKDCSQVTLQSVPKPAVRFTHFPFLFGAGKAKKVCAGCKRKCNWDQLITLTVILEANGKVNDANQLITNGTEFVNIMNDVSQVLKFLIRSISCTCRPKFLLYRITDPCNENSLSCRILTIPWEVVKKTDILQSG